MRFTDLSGLELSAVTQNSTGLPQPSRCPLPFNVPLLQALVDRLCSRTLSEAQPDDVISVPTPIFATPWSPVSPGVVAAESPNIGKKIRDILKGKKGSIKQAELPPGSPSWDDPLDKTWEDIEKGANERKPGYDTIRKLLSDRRFNK